VKRMLATAAIAAVPATPAVAPADCSSTTCLERVAKKQCSSLRFNRCLDRASLTYRIPEAKSWLYRVSWCESRWQQFARNASGSTSYFQFLPSTWATTRYRFRWIYSPRFQALAAAEMYRAGRASEWVCN
jgi:hypothetical protein